MAVTAALVFAGQMINYTIPGTGSSGHMCGGMLLSALLGPYAGFLSMIVILAIQCLFFADGGLMALNDRLKLRSMVVGEKDDRVFIASEEAAIRGMEPDVLRRVQIIRDTQPMPFDPKIMLQFTGLERMGN